MRIRAIFYVKIKSRGRCAILKKKAQKNSEIKKRRNDLLLFLAIILLASVSMLFILAKKEAGNIAQVKLGSDIIGEYPLSVNTEQRISSEEDGYNILVIEDGQAYIKKASCPDKICAGHPSISEVGETIVCLPNKVSVVIIE